MRKSEESEESVQDQLNKVLGDYQRASRQNLEGISFENMPKLMLSNIVCQVLAYMATIEEATIFYRKIVGTSVHKAINFFVEMWFSEETRHGQLLKRFLSALDFDFRSYEQKQNQSLAMHEKKLWRYAWAHRLLRDEFLVVYLLIGLTQEIITGTGYSLMGRIDPYLGKILQLIAKEEQIHIRFYGGALKAFLRGSDVPGWRKLIRQVLIPEIVAASFVPVGGDLLPMEGSQTMTFLLSLPGAQEELKKNLITRLGQVELERQYALDIFDRVLEFARQYELRAQEAKASFLFLDFFMKEVYYWTITACDR